MLKEWYSPQLANHIRLNWWCETEETVSKHKKRWYTTQVMVTESWNPKKSTPRNWFSPFTLGIITGTLFSLYFDFFKI